MDVLRAARAAPGARRAARRWRPGTARSSCCRSPARSRSAVDVPAHVEARYELAGRRLGVHLGHRLRATPAGTATLTLAQRRAGPRWRCRRRAATRRLPAGVRRRPTTCRSRSAAPGRPPGRSRNFGVPGCLGPRRQARLLRAGDPARATGRATRRTSTTRREPVPGGQRGDLLLPDRRRRPGHAVAEGFGLHRTYTGPEHEAAGLAPLDETLEVRDGDVVLVPTATTARASPRPATRCTTST